MFCFFVSHKIKLLIQQLTTSALSQSHRLEGFCVTTVWEVSLLCAHEEEDSHR